MNAALAPSRLAALMRGARVGDLLPAATVDWGPTRRLHATAFLLPGHGSLGIYRGRLDAARCDFDAWDGRVAVLAADGEPQHRVAIVDRYGQVYDAIDAADAVELPDAGVIQEWFKFLATACPECGVLDDPRERDWVP